MRRLIKLYDLKRNTRIDVSHLNIKNEDTGELLRELNFHHIDGMYSLCKDDEGAVIHLQAWTEVKDLGPMKESEINKD